MNESPVELQLHVPTPKPHEGAVAIYFLYHGREDGKRVVFYVGKAKDPRKRREAHQYSARGANGFHAYRKIRKLAAAGVEVGLQVVNWANSDAEALAKEVSYIATIRSAKVPLTNITPGGEGAVGLVHSAERSGLTNLNNAISGNSGYKAGPKAV